MKQLDDNFYPLSHASLTCCVYPINFLFPIKQSVHSRETGWNGLKSETFLTLKTEFFVTKKGVTPLRPLMNGVLSKKNYGQFNGNLP